MQIGRADYEATIELIKKFEAKYKRKIGVQELTLYIQKQRNIKLDLAKNYVKDLAEMKKINVSIAGVEIVK